MILKGKISIYFCLSLNLNEGRTYNFKTDSISPIVNIFLKTLLFALMSSFLKYFFLVGIPPFIYNFLSVTEDNRLIYLIGRLADPQLICMV